MAAGGALLTFLGGTGTGFSAGPAITLPIFEGGRLRSQLGAASAQYDQAVEHYNGTLVGALKEIADQVVRIRSLDSQARRIGPLGRGGAARTISWPTKATSAA